MKLNYLLLLTTGDTLETLGTEQSCDDPLLGDHSKRLNENDGFPDQGTVMYVCDPEFFGQSGSYTTVKCNRGQWYGVVPILGGEPCVSYDRLQDDGLTLYELGSNEWNKNFRLKYKH